MSNSQPVKRDMPQIDPLIANFLEEVEVVCSYKTAYRNNISNLTHLLPFSAWCAQLQHSRQLGDFHDFGKVSSSVNTQRSSGSHE